MTMTEWPTEELIAELVDASESLKRIDAELPEAVAECDRQRRCTVAVYGDRPLEDWPGSAYHGISVLKDRVAELRRLRDDVFGYISELGSELYRRSGMADSEGER